MTFHQTSQGGGYHIGGLVHAQVFSINGQIIIVGIGDIGVETFPDKGLAVGFSLNGSWSFGSGK